MSSEQTPAQATAPKPKVFIHVNHKQILGAIVGKYSLEKHSAHADRFAVEFIEVRNQPFLHAKEGELYLRHGDKRSWLNDDLQSFTPLRFMPPELMGYQGRAVVIDPDVFAVGDVWELLSRDMDGMALMCRPKSGNKGKHGALASSVMLLDCAQLTHWRVEEQFNEMFAFKHDYMDWISLKLEDRSRIGLFEDEWNDFDRLTPRTKLLHTTKRRHQPWKTGLPIDFRPADKFRLFPPKHWLRRARRAVFGDYALAGTYKRHPDPAQEAFFFRLVSECLDEGIISEQDVRHEMAHNHVRHDALELVRQQAA
ncbi:hypothetical protein [Pseudohaliea rubra]|uniref:Uncharacterized protein n=1 Tax=Pseudohaliea rubra DSM 19751 TaxID=1265313 RepID=A0A095VRX6_9GAMM|nr:hypothetical protein [Pseudohaliea rubra]KGE03858.1 hypothetical protein HRUBRA_01605 [Pseudohaliea rubra DSM 19751]